MAKSLTETAKSIINNQRLMESNDSAPDRDAKAMNPNRATLKPGSKSPEGRFSNPGASEPSAPDNTVQDLGPALVKQGDVPPSAKAVKDVSKDTSASSQKGKPSGEDFGVDSESKQDRKSKTVMEDIEITEELESFIQEMLDQGLSEEEIATAIAENFELVESKDEDSDDSDEDDSDDSDDSDDKEDKKEDKEDKEEKKVDMKEHVEALFNGEDLSEEFKEKATTIFEAAVNAKVEQEVARIEEAYAETLEEKVSEITESLTANVDDYLNYVVEQWVSENEVAIESGLRTELTEDFITGLQKLFAENYIDIPEDKIQVVEELGTKVNELEKRLNEEIERNVQLNKNLNESKKFEILVTACDGLTDTQAEKLKSLAEGVEFTTASEFNTKVKTLKESYFPFNVDTSNVLDKTETDSSDKSKVLSESVDPRMERYVRTLGRKLPV